MSVLLSVFWIKDCMCLLNWLITNSKFRNNFIISFVFSFTSSRWWAPWMGIPLNSIFVSYVWYIFKCSINIDWERDWDRDWHWLTCCSTYLCIHWLILVHALTRDKIRILGVLGWHSNQLSYPARTSISIFWLSIFLKFPLSHRLDFLMSFFLFTSL